MSLFDSILPPGDPNAQTPNNLMAMIAQNGLPITAANASALSRVTPSVTTTPGAPPPPDPLAALRDAFAKTQAANVPNVAPAPAGGSPSPTPTTPLQAGLAAGSDAAANTRAESNPLNTLLISLAHGVTAGVPAFRAQRQANQEAAAAAAVTKAKTDDLNTFVNDPTNFAAYGSAGAALQSSVKASIKLGDPNGAAKLLQDNKLYAPPEVVTTTGGGVYQKPTATQVGKWIRQPDTIGKPGQTFFQTDGQNALVKDPTGAPIAVYTVPGATPKSTGLLTGAPWALAASMKLPQDASTWTTDQAASYRRMQQSILNASHPQAAGPKIDPMLQRQDAYIGNNQSEITRAVTAISGNPTPSSPALAWASGEGKIGGMSLPLFTANADPQTRAWLGALREIAQAKLSRMPQGTRATQALIESSMKEFINSTRTGYTGSTLEGSVLDTQRGLDRLGIAPYIPGATPGATPGAAPGPARDAIRTATARAILNGSQPGDKTVAQNWLKQHP